MAKIKSSFFCSNCGFESAKWLGKCSSCNEWNTFVEEVIDKGNEKENWKDYTNEKKTNKVIALQDVHITEERRIVTDDAELNRVLGGGIVTGSIVLIAGEPGIGKSTLFLQHGLMMKNLRVLYISGEESEQQIKMRADRLKQNNDNFYLLTETVTQTIFQEIKKLKPQLVIVDSIQTLQSNLIDSSAGSVSQIRETAAEFQRYAKETNTPVF
jgi:DNA repair protein RadA/Sms